MLMVWLHIFLLFFQENFNKPNSFVWIQDISIKSDFILTDQLNNVYALRNNSINRISFLENSKISYSSTQLGEIYSADVSDPFRLILFYKNFNKVLFLNNQLAELRSAIDLNDLGYLNVLAVGASSRGGFWIYENDLGQLIYIDKSLVTAQKSSLLLDLIDNSSELENAQIVEKNDFVYLGIPGQGIFQFDIYGTFLKKYPLNECSNFQVIGQNIVYFSNNELRIYNTQTYEKETSKLPVEKIVDGKVEGLKVFLLLNDRISIYSINN